MKEVVAKKDLFGLSEEAVGTIVRDVAYGRKLGDVALEHGLTVAEVRSVIDRMAHGWFNGDNLKRELYLEVARLSALGKKYFIEALRGDQSAAMLYLRTVERKSLLAGLNSMQGAAHVVINQTVAPQRQTTTAEISSIIDEIRALPKN